MKKIISVLLATMLCSAVALSTVISTSAAFNQEAKPKKGDTVAVLHTNYGDIAMSFFPKYAPKGVENFQTLAQGGDYTNSDGTGGESCWGKDFENECVDELSNIRGSVAYANSGADTNGSQFYINSVDNSASLDNGYTVFGQVFAGMDVVDLISDCEKTYGSDGNESSPVNTVELKSVDIEKYSSDIEKDLAKATDPYEGQKSTSAESTTPSDNNETTSPADASEEDEPFNFIPIIVTVGILAVIFACFAIPYGIQDRKKKKAKAEAKAKMKASPDYKKKKSTKKRK